MLTTHMIIIIMLVCVVAPVLTRTSPRVVAIPSGGAAQLLCQGQGRPRPEITWLKDGVELVPGAHETLLRRCVGPAETINPDFGVHLSA